MNAGAATASVLTHQPASIAIAPARMTDASTPRSAMKVVAQAGLVTLAVAGGDLVALMEKLKVLPGVDSVAAFGENLHVNGTDRAALEAAVAPYRAEPGRTWQEAPPTMEDVFIHYMSRAA